MVELYQTVNRIMNMGERSLSTSARRAASDSEAQVRPVAALRGGGGAVLGADGLGETWDAIGSAGNVGDVSPGQDMVMQELIDAKSELQRSKQHVAMLQAQLQADKLRLSPSALSSPADEKRRPGLDLEQALSCVSSASCDKALDCDAIRSGAKAIRSGALSGAREQLAAGSLEADFGKSLEPFVLSRPSMQAMDASSRETTGVMPRSTSGCDAIWNEAVSLSPAQVFHAKSKRGLSVPVEFVPSPDGDQDVGDQDAGASEGGKTVEESEDAPDAVWPAVGGAAEPADKEWEPSAEGGGVDAPKVMGDLQDLAHEFPSCAKYLMSELDSRRQVVPALAPACRSASLLVLCGSALRLCG